jgi:hypothetical protein
MPGPTFQAFFDAMCQERPTVLKRRLLPFSIGHCFLLRALNSPYVCGGIRRAQDCILGVFICSRDWETNQRDLVHGEMDVKTAMGWGKETRDDDIRADILAFGDYIGAGFRMPKTYEFKGKHEAAAPFELHLRYIMASSFGVPLAQTWDIPLAEASALHEVRVERQRLQEGQESQLISDRTAALLEQARAIREAANGKAGAA